MELLISSKQHNNITLTLKQGRKILDTVDFEFDKNLDTKLIQTIDFLIKRNKIDVFALDRVVIGLGIDKDSSSYKMLKAWQAGMDFALKM